MALKNTIMILVYILLLLSAGLTWARGNVLLVESICEEQMEAAMRAMDVYIHPTISSESYDGCNYCTSTGCTVMHCSGGPEQELARLNWEVEQAKKQIEDRRKHTEALKRWDDVKRECWRHP